MRDRLLHFGLETLEDSGREPDGFGIEGYVGNALFACALQRVEPAVGAETWIARAMEAFNQHGAPPSLHDGFAGLGYVLATYLGAEEILADVDGALTEHLPRLDAPSMQSGIAGVALYASLRSQAATGRELQRAITDALGRAAVPRDGGVVWQTSLDYARGRGIVASRGPVTELGMVHGIGGTLVALSSLAKQGVSGAADLARAGLLAAWAREHTGANRFGRIDVGENGEETTPLDDPSRWCVGDIGVLRALWITAGAVEEPLLAERALTALRGMATTAAAAPVRSTGRLDLCCGISAPAQVYLEMHRDTGEEIFRQANRRLLEGCAAGLEGMGARGFRYGKLGVILALLSAETEADLGWDGILGMRLPAPLVGS